VKRAHSITDEAVCDAVYQLLHKRGCAKSVCPSEVARILSPLQWRDLMSQVRQVGWRLAEQRIIKVTQKGEVVQPGVSGPLRFSQGDCFIDIELLYKR